MYAKEEVIFTIIIVIFILIFIAIMFMVFLVRNNARKNRLVFENERIRKEYEETLMNSRLEIQEHTLNYVSREIHDNVGQMLSLVRLQLNGIESPKDIEDTDQLLEKAIADLRQLSHTLNTNHIKEKGFAPSVAELLKQFERSGKFKTVFINSEEPFHLSDDNGLIIFRVVQELLNNISKHAAASEIRIELRKKPTYQEVIISDNGKGFDTKAASSGGIGLRNISDRVEIMGGNLTINSEISKGTTVNIRIPHDTAPM
ncbi:MAG: sensor histidine kinase [Chitinophagaceae bacterium]|nr:sensor histidine kinase [Chitinophagaceae bacterium]